MPNQGFINDPLANINLLRDTLRDRYCSGFPVIKELVQNADDAEANLLRFLWTDGLVDVKHPLLSGPALVVINDGPFSPEDAQAIRRMGINYKAADKGSVGKFGLGLKSIFHLCETFFYLVNGVETSPAGWEAKVLNPWSGPNEGLHDDWDEFSDACQTAIVRHLNILPLPERWFVLWIPLRLRAHCLECDPIVSEFFDARDASDILPADLGRQLEPVVPFLRKVHTVEGLEYRRQSVPKSLFQVNVNNGFTRRRFPDRMEAGRPLFVGGSLTSREGDGTTRNCVVAGYEVFIENDAIRAIKNHENWPRTASLKSTKGEPEKSEPHAAVYFVRSDALRGRLTVQWSVFLPIGDPEPEIVFPGDFDFSLIMHGYFFVDAGRSRIEKFVPLDEIAPAVNESEVRSRWNWRLASDGVMPLVIPALELFVTEASLEDAEILNLTRSLTRTTLISSFRGQICAQQQWIYRLGDAGGQWLTIDKNESVYSIPAPPDSDPHRPGRALAGFVEMCREHIVTYDGRPSLRTSAKFDVWPDELVARVLQHENGDIFRRKDDLNYVADFIRAQSTVGCQTNEQMKNLLTRAFRELTFDELRPVKQTIQDLLSHVAPKERLALSVASSEVAQTQFRGLAGLELGILLIPNDFDCKELSAGELELSAAGAALHWLARNYSTDDNELIETRWKIAIQLIGKVKDLQELLSECSQLNLFVAFDAKSQRHDSVSVESLQNALERGLLFLESQDSSLALALQTALADDALLFVKRELATALFTGGRVPRCGHDECVKVIAACPRLEGPQKRVGLLRELARDAIDEGEIKVVRYLLHGDADRFDDKRVLIAGVS